MSAYYRILVVDDDDGCRTGLAELLQQEGFEVHTARDGETGLLRLKQLSYNLDLVISDFILPRMDGLEFLKKARLSERKIPAIIFTARRNLHLNGQPFHVLYKPIDLDPLLDQVRHTLRSHQETLEHPTQLIRSL